MHRLCVRLQAFALDELGPHLNRGETGCCCLMNEANLFRNSQSTCAMSPYKAHHPTNEHIVYALPSFDRGGGGRELDGKCQTLEMARNRFI